MAAHGVISYWWLPVLSALVWLGMLLGMLLHWVIDTHEEIYPPMQKDHQTIAFISDIGAFELKPLFITGSVLTTVLLDLSFAAERWLRHKGRLVPNSTLTEKILSIASIIFAIAGTAGLILLSIFDTYQYPHLHDGFLLLFIAGYVLSAICLCWESQRLGIKNRQHRSLRISFWVKLSFVFIELCLAIAFASLDFTKHKNAAAIFEWIVALIFTFYVLSFVIDLAPAAFTKAPDSRYAKKDVEMATDMEEGNSHNDLPHTAAGALPDRS